MVASSGFFENEIHFDTLDLIHFAGGGVVNDIGKRLTGSLFWASVVGKQLTGSLLNASVVSCLALPFFICCVFINASVPSFHKCFTCWTETLGRGTALEEETEKEGARGEAEEGGEIPDGKTETGAHAFAPDAEQHQGARSEADAPHFSFVRV